MSQYDYFLASDEMYLQLQHLSTDFFKDSYSTSISWKYYTNC
jgi:hypothetical protein